MGNEILHGSQESEGMTIVLTKSIPRVRRQYNMYRDAGPFMDVVDAVLWIAGGGGINLNGRNKAPSFARNLSVACLEKAIREKRIRRAIKDGTLKKERA